MVFQCINIRQVSWEVLKTAAFGLGFQHLPRDLANVNAWKTMFDRYIKVRFAAQYREQNISVKSSPYVKKAKYIVKVALLLILFLRRLNTCVTCVMSTKPMILLRYYRWESG